MSARRKLLSPGARVPEFRLARLEGGDVSLHDLLGEAPVMLAFFKITCPVCQLTLPYLDRVHTPGRLPIYAVSQNDSADTGEFLRRFRVNLPTLLDSEDDDFPASNAFGITSVPTMFLIESDGTVSRVIEGWSKQDIESLGAQAGIAVIRDGEDVPAWKAG